MSGSLLVVEPGFFTTVQDLGRPGYAASGVSAAGAADPVAVRAGNRLVGNPPGAAVLEMTLVAATVRFGGDAVVALTGDAGSPWSARHLRPGETLAGGPCRGGARRYLCVRGGVEVPLVLGSASTHVATGLGGLSGRALRAGDRLAIGDLATGEPRFLALDPRSIPGYGDGTGFRIVDGPQRSWFKEAEIGRFLDATWEVSEASDRMGIRLEGPPLARDRAGELLTEGVALGAVQVSSDGRPIVLFVDHQTTGGYPKIANVIAADLPRLARLRPRDRLRFERVTLEDARRALLAQEDTLRELLG